MMIKEINKLKTKIKNNDSLIMALSLENEVIKETIKQIKKGSIKDGE